MRSASGSSDLTARASIRNAALALFAEFGHDAVSVRQIASAAGVSPALVLHHFGSKEGLRAAVNEFAAAAFDDVTAIGEHEEVAGTFADGDPGSIAQLFAQVFPPGSPLPAYLRRLLLDGDPAGTALFQRWFDATGTLLRAMTDLGIATPSEDPTVRAGFVLANDLALILLREPLRAALGFDPLDPAGVQRWVAEAMEVYRGGLWQSGSVTDPQSGTHRNEEENGNDI